MRPRLLCALCVLTACRASPQPDATPAQSEEPSATLAIASAAPVDHLAPGELLEGGQHAFGIVLPRDLPIEEAFVDVVYANGRVPVHAVVQYLRPRLQEGDLREGDSAATFDHVKVRGQPGLELRIRITTAPEGTRVELRDSTPHPAPNLPDEAARWKQAGLTPDGRLANPTHLD